MMRKAILASLICSAGLTSAFAAGSVSGNFKITAKVPQLCDIKAGTSLDFDLGEYLSVEKSDYKNLKVNCKQNTKYQLSLELGSNPQSTVDKRRLPLNGEAGDVENYLTYSVHVKGPTTAPLGIDANKFSGTISAYSNAGEDLPIYVKLAASQPAASVGTYTDTLVFTLDYQ